MYSSVFDLLLKTVKDINKVFLTGKSLLAKGFEVLVKILVERSAECRIKVLLQAGANPNLRAENGKTALAIALEEQKIEVADLLRQAGGS